ncbi:hypothetical protein D3C71_1831790 [compost metagenome]
MQGLLGLAESHLDALQHQPLHTHLPEAVENGASQTVEHASRHIAEGLAIQGHLRECAAVTRRDRVQRIGHDRCGLAGHVRDLGLIVVPARGDAIHPVGLRGIHLSPAVLHDGDLLRVHLVRDVDLVLQGFALLVALGVRQFGAQL